MARPKLKDIEVDKILNSKSILFEEIEMFYDYGFDVKLNKYLSREYKNKIPNDLNNELSTKIREFYTKRYKNKKSIPVILFESTEEYKKKEYLVKNSCWAKQLSFGDSIYINEKDLANKSKLYGMTVDELIEFLKDWGFKYYSSGEFKARENRLHLFKSITDASVWTYEQINKCDHKKLTGYDKLVANSIINNNIRKKITRALKNKGSCFGYIVIKLDDID